MHATMETTCVEDLLVAHPVLQALFTFLQMHFLFVNSQVVVERFGLAARFGFVHLVATNLSLWVRTVIWESANDWIHHVYRVQSRGGGGGGGVAVSSSSPELVEELPIALGLRTSGKSFLGPYNNNYFSERSFLDTATANSYLDASLYAHGPDVSEQIGEL